MTREKARVYVCSHRGLSFGALRRLIEVAREAPDQASVVNPSITHAQALDVLEAAIETRPDEQPVSMFKTGDILIATNIVRECL